MLDWQEIEYSGQVQIKVKYFVFVMDALSIRYELHFDMFIFVLKEH